MVPVGLEHATDGELRLRWQDLGRFHCYDGFFDSGLDRMRAMLGGDPPGITSTLAALDSLPLDDCIAPTGLIFHTGRCGSTLLAKVLARSRRNIVVGEASVHNAFWNLLPGRGDREIEQFRRLVLAMGRRRLETYSGHIVKFTSYNVLRHSAIRSSFPDTPTIFLFREPQATLDSIHASPPGFIQSGGIAEFRFPSPEQMLEDYMEAALAIPDTGMRVLDYSHLKPQFLPAILDWFRQKPDPAELRQMLSEFDWDAKGGIGARFVGKQRAQRGVVSPRHLELYTALRDRAKRDWPELPQ